MSQHAFIGLDTGSLALDTIPVATIYGTGSWAIGIYNNLFYFYEYDADTTASQSSPDIVIPNDNVTGTGAWELRNVGYTDHGDLSGRTDDDHSIYFNETRGDIRYYTQTTADTLLASKSDDDHDHSGVYEPADSAIAKTDETNDFTEAVTLSAMVSFDNLFRITSDTSPATIESNQNNYNPANFSSSSRLRLTSDAERDITGLQGGIDGRFVLLRNVGEYTITLKNEDANSTAGYRFDLVDDFELQANGIALLVYDSTLSRWGLIGGASITVSDTAYDATSWDSNTDAASKNSIRDKFVSMDSTIATNTAKNSYPATDSTKMDFISVTQAVDLDSMESDIATNTAKDTYPATDSTKMDFISVTQAVDLDTMESDIASLGYPATDSTKMDFISVTQAVDLDSMESDIATNTAKDTYPATDSTKMDFMSITQAVDLDSMESDIATNTAKDTYPATDSTKMDFISVTQAVDLDAMESDIATNTAKSTYPGTDSTKLLGIETGAEVNVQSDWNAISGDELILNKPSISGMTWSIASSATTAIIDNGYLIDASGAPVQISLPASPSEGNTIGLCDYTNSATSNTITIGRNGMNIESIAEDLIIDIDGLGFNLIYTDATVGWKVLFINDQ